MAGFPKAERQKIIDEYLASTGRNMFHAGEFVDWLKDEPQHEAYDWFYGKEDAEAAREYRIGLARQMASGLRIVTRISQPSKGKSVAVEVREFPALISPVENRSQGGGYQPFDPDDAAAQAELRRQGSSALISWLGRYRGAAEFAGIDVTAIEAIAAELSAQEAA